MNDIDEIMKLRSKVMEHEDELNKYISENFNNTNYKVSFKMELKDRNILKSHDHTISLLNMRLLNTSPSDYLDLPHPLYPHKLV